MAISSRLGDAAERDRALELGLRDRIGQRDLVDRRVDGAGRDADDR